MVVVFRQQQRFSRRLWSRQFSSESQLMSRSNTSATRFNVFGSDLMADYCRG
ncbi:hypothetical protein Hanom_Chr05g00422431 [Helianthus anomalus]